MHGNHRAHKLKDNPGTDVGHDAEGEDRSLEQSAAGEEVIHRDDAAGLLGGHFLHNGLKHFGVDTGQWDARAHSGDEEETERD